MMVSGTDSDREIAEDVLPLPTDDLAVPVDLDVLQPWHRPRKQFVREKQWVYFARRLIERESGTPALPIPDDGRPEVRYLTLPGMDYLDVRLLADACKELNCDLTATGFLAGNERNPHVARAKVTEQALIDSGHITDRSFTRPSRFEELADRRSQAYLDIQQRGPFHVVNVDACGSIAPPTVQSRRLIDAVHELATFQFSYKAGSWVLFLTTDARPSSVATDTVANLWRAVEENASADNEFRHRAVSLFGLQDDAEIASLHENVRLPGEKFLKVFSLGLAKWLLHIAGQYSYRMKAHSAYCYSTTQEDDETPTMACLAFEFMRQKPGRPDPFCVVNPEPKRAGETGPVLSDSVRAADKIGEMDNLDVRMRDDDLRRRYVSRTQALLEQVGYSPAALMQLHQW